MTSHRIILVLLALLAASGARAATIELTVNGLVCGFCAQGIESSLVFGIRPLLPPPQ
jgi:hypothetical protein